MNGAALTPARPLQVAALKPMLAQARAPALVTRAVAVSDPGLRRPRNEDTWLCDDAVGLHAVCDGLGGHARGDVASQLAARVALTVVQSRSRVISHVANGGPATSLADLVEEAVLESACLEGLVQHALCGGGKDNITAVLIDVVSAERPRSRKPTLRGGIADFLTTHRP